MKMQITVCKLGYGGTKTEMERLLVDAEQLTGIKYDISNFGDVTAAIHAIQGELGITGVAANEASTTFTGSFAAMRAAAQNLLADLSLGNTEAILGNMTALGQSISDFLFNNLFPMIGNIISGIPVLVAGLFTTLLPQLLEGGLSMIENLTTGITTNLPTMLAAMQQGMSDFLQTIQDEYPELIDRGVEAISNFATGILNNLPAVITAIGDIINSLYEFVYSNYPTIMEKGFELISNLATGILNNLPAIINAITNVLAKMLTTIASHLPQILQKGIELMGKLAAGIIQAIPTVLSAVAQIITNMLSKFKETNWASIGRDICSGIAKGLKAAASVVINAVKSLAKRALESVKDFFDIGSPSKVMAEEVGKWLPAGIAVGIEDNLNPLSTAIDEMNETAGISTSSGLARATAYSYGANVTSGSGGYDRVVGLLEKYLPNIGSDIYMDEVKVGKIMNKQLGLAL